MVFRYFADLLLGPRKPGSMVMRYRFGFFLAANIERKEVKHLGRKSFNEDKLMSFIPKDK